MANFSPAHKQQCKTSAWCTAVSGFIEQVGSRISEIPKQLLFINPIKLQRVADNILIKGGECPPPQPE